jgi:hypothetical protein
MEANGVHRYDPVHFCYIQSMVRRASGKSGSAYAAIEDKAQTALDEYWKNYNIARLKAEEMVKRVCSVFPDAEVKIRALFDNNEFKKVHRLVKKLDRRHRQADFCVLKDLVVRFTPDSEDKHSQSSQSAVDCILRQQERHIITSLEGSPDGERPAQNTGKYEIRSLQRFKDTMVRLHSDRLVTRAIHDLPENSGPHNSQMLATGSLSALRQISPNYLNRFVSHIGALIFLKETGEDVDRLKSKKKKKNRTA